MFLVRPGFVLIPFYLCVFQQSGVPPIRFHSLSKQALPPLLCTSDSKRLALQAKYIVNSSFWHDCIHIFSLILNCFQILFLSSGFCVYSMETRDYCRKNSGKNCTIIVHYILHRLGCNSERKVYPEFWNREPHLTINTRKRSIIALCYS